ncbi:MAG: LPS assembly lipoprotein LptE [Emcibacter sp.]|nr:LPS assembly lipoprotein LptE [Emcibacter sp.]
MRLILVLITTVMLASCGFKPMYGQFSDGKGDLRDVMANIRVSDITEQGRPSRIGQVIRNSLLDQLTPFGETKQAEYILKVTFLIEEHGYGIRQNDSVTLQNLKLVASFQLEDVNSSKVILDSAARALVTYDLAQSDYSNMIARNAALKRLSQDVANQMATRIGAYFNKTATKEHSSQ